MKIFTRLILFYCLLLFSIQARAQISIPYSEAFTSITAANGFPTVSGGAWTRSGTTTNQPTYIANQSTYNRSGNGDTKFITFRYDSGTRYYFVGPFNLDATKTYQASVLYKADGATGFGPLALTYGTTAAAGTQTNTIVSVPANITNLSFNTLSGSFVPTSTGSYYLAIKSTQNGNPWYLTLDDFSLIELNPCTTPAPGNTIASVSTVCSGVSFNLSLQNSVPGTGITYQWQSADDAGFTSGVTNLGTAVTQTTSQTAAKYYRCNVTCSTGPVTVASTPVQVAMEAAINCYCTTSPSIGGTGDIITNATIGAYSNTTTYSAPAYFTSYNNSPVNMTQSSTISCSMTYGTDATQHGAVWVDWDQSGTFDAGENVYLSTSASTGSATVSFNVTVPAGAVVGNTRMRFRGGSDAAYTAAGACTASTYGETEDYIVNIVAFTACSGTPEAGSISGSLNRPTCPGVAPSPATITATGATAAAADITYQWEESTNSGGSWANVTGGSGATTTTYTPPVYAGTPIQYRLKVTCTATSLFDVSDVVVSIVNPDVPSTQASAVSTSALSNTSATITWTSGNGGRRYVVLNTANSFTAPASTADVVVAGTAYTSGEQIVYDGTGSSVSVTGLAPNTTYYVRVYEYLRCTGTPNNNYYNVTTATNNPGSFTTPLYCTAVPSSVDGNGITNVVLGSLSNPNTSTTTYQNFTTGLSVPDLTQGMSYRVRLQFDVKS